MTVPPCARTYFDIACDGLLNLVTARTLFTSALQAHWSNPAHHQSTIGGDELGCLQWGPDGEQILPANRLTVAPTWTLDPDNPFQGVYIGTPGGMSLTKTVVNNYTGHSDDQSTNQFYHRADVGLVFSHVHRSPDVALLMASSTHVFLYALREHLKQHQDFMGFEPLNNTDPQLLEKSATTYYKVDLPATFSFNYRVSISLESHRLKEWGLALSANGA